MSTNSGILDWVYNRAGGLFARLARAPRRREQLAVGSERKFRDLLESAPDATVIVDRRGQIDLVNAQAEILFGYKRHEIIGEHVNVLVPEASRSRHSRQLNAYMRSAETRPMGANRELLARRKDGTEFPAEISLSPLETEQGLLVSAVVRDITERKSAEAKLRFLADHDGPTGLLNRRSFEENLTREVAMATRYELDGMLVLIDIDGLKDINDTLGHAQGDELIRVVAEQIRTRVRNTDIVARVGGDEFGVLMPNTDATAARIVATELLGAIRDAGVVLGAQRLRASACAGLAGFEHGKESPQDVMIAADHALYDAKESGRARAALYLSQPDDSADREIRAGWSKRIRHGLDEDLFVPYRQPILDLASGQITRYELLARLLDESGHPTPPGAFLPPAERSGLVRDIDRRMVSAAIELIAEGAGGPPISYEVNLSALSLSDSELPATIADRIEESGIDPALLVLEITETAAIANMEQARDFASSLRRLGCRFALDDFGAGFASFLYLQHIPLDALKIDGGFIRKLGTNQTDELLVQHMAEIAHSLELFTIAEYVEDERTLELLAEYAIDAAQGFFIGHPEPIRDAGPPVLLPPTPVDVTDGE